MSAINDMAILWTRDLEEELRARAATARKATKDPNGPWGAMLYEWADHLDTLAAATQEFRMRVEERRRGHDTCRKCGRKEVGRDLA